ncbi:hypothetical protein [Microbacterium sp. E-13]|uniref:hypothetical protein n=1 Tax=Microbacterium sp. E-13 TaxID=3404048 RepID=UPI003CE9610F
MKRDDVHQLILTPLGDRAWRLCDRGVARHDVASLVAYVELLDSGAYEAVWVGVGLGSARFTSLDALFRAAIEKLDQSRSLGAGKPEHIPSRPPARA